MMYQVNKFHPDWYLLPIYIEYGLVALMFICFLIIPETPWFYGRRGDKEAAMKTMRRLYGRVEGYDMEEEWGVIVRSIAHEKTLMEAAKAQSWTQVFKGFNGVSPSDPALTVSRNACLSFSICALVSKSEAMLSSRYTQPTFSSRPVLRIPSTLP